MTTVTRSVLLLLLVLTPGRGASQSNAPSLAFTHVTVIDGTGAPARADMTAVVADGRIADLAQRQAAEERPAPLLARWVSIQPWPAEPSRCR